MTITLGPRAEELIRRRMQEGQYATPEEVVLAGLESLGGPARDEFAPGELEALIAEGETSAAAEGWIPAEQVFAEMEQMSQQRRSKGR